jgi:hypothetical protein
MESEMVMVRCVENKGRSRSCDVRCVLKKREKEINSKRVAWWMSSPYSDRESAFDPECCHFVIYLDPSSESMRLLLCFALW